MQSDLYLLTHTHTHTHTHIHSHTHTHLKQSGRVAPGVPDLTERIVRELDKLLTTVVKTAAVQTVLEVRLGAVGQRRPGVVEDILRVAFGDCQCRHGYREQRHSRQTEEHHVLVGGQDGGG